MIYFTVSMWNRQTHFQLLLEDLQKIYRHDPDIALYVTDFCTFTGDEMRGMLDKMPFRTRFFFVGTEFCNGQGHNICIRHITDNSATVAVIAVDLEMPSNITDDIRRHAVRSRSFYGPMVRYQCKDGRLKRCRAAYALLAANRRDIERSGRLQQNMQWGGDRREGGEDVTLAKKLKNIGLDQRRPFHPQLVCRWHPRNVDQRYYTSHHRYNVMPWWDLVDDQGKPVG